MREVSDMADEQAESRRARPQVPLDVEQFKQEVAEEISADLKRIRAGKGSKERE